MKKVLNVLSVTGFMFFGAVQSTFAQEAAATESSAAASEAPNATTASTTAS